MHRLLLALPLCLAPACAIARSTENRPLEASSLGSLQPGKTTAREVVELLGAPSDVVQLGRRSAYLYRFTNIKHAALVLILVNFYNQDEHTDRAWLFFDDKDVLTHMGVTLEGHQSEYAMPWEKHN